MKTDRVRLNLFVILLPLIVLFVAGGYFSYSTWGKYLTISELQNRLEKLVLLKSLEESVSQEAICTAKMQGEKNELKDICNNSRVFTDRVVEELAQQSSHIPLYQKIDTLLSENNQSKKDRESIFGEEALSVILQSIRYNFDTSQELKIDKLMNGAYQKRVLDPINDYWQEVSNYSDASNKPFLTFFLDMNRLYTNSVTETIFGTYFLSNKRAFRQIDLVHWDKYMAQANMPDIENYKNISPIKDSLLKIFSTEGTQELIKNIDKMSIDILMGYATGNYDVKTDKWIFLNKQKQSLFILAESQTLEYLSDKNRDIIQKYEMIMVGGLTISLLSMIFFIFTAISHSKRIKEEDTALTKMMHEIEVLTAESKKEVLSSEELINDFSDKKQIYIYISSILKLLHEKELQAGEANDAKDLFLANMSHEIRTPLNGIVGFTQLLKESELSDDQKEFIDIIENSSDNLLTIVNDILDLSKISANKMELEQVNFDLYEKAESAIETFSAKADEKRVELGILVDPLLPRNYIGDPTKLTQVLINLISNALKFTPEDGSIDLKIEIVPNENEESNEFTTVRFAVKDSGIGISKEQKQKIFQAFTQADSSTSRKFGGTGLGLTISQAIIEYMGGKLDVISKEGEGAEFFFKLRLETSPRVQEVIYPDFTNIEVGLALPDIEHIRQTDLNLQKYAEYMGATFHLFSYTDLFDKNKDFALPRVLFIDGAYIKDMNELRVFSKLNTQLILMGGSSIKSILDGSEKNFLKAVHKPMSITKTARIIESSLGKVKVSTERKDAQLKTDRFSNIRALVAEDNVINQKLIMATLQNFGINVTITSHGKEALEERQKEDYDIIFMDIQMPVMSGVEATHAILEYEKEYNLTHVPIIALTANALKGDKERYMSAGMDNYASKPLDLAELKNIIGTYFPESTSELDEISVSTKSKESSSKSIESAKEQDLDKAEEQNILSPQVKEEPHKEIESILPPQKDTSTVHESILLSDEEIDSAVITEEENIIAPQIQEETTPAPRVLDSSEISILLYNKMALQANIYRSIFKGLGYEVEIAANDDKFLDALDSGDYTYAMYDERSFQDMACSVADIARDADIEPIIFVEDDKDEGFCAKTLRINSDRDTIKNMLQNIS